MSKSAIVIGAGVIGSSVAWELAKNGYSVTVVDKNLARAKDLLALQVQ